MLLSFAMSDRHYQREIFTSADVLHENHDPIIRVYLETGTAEDDHSFPAMLNFPAAAAII